MDLTVLNLYSILNNIALSFLILCIYGIND